VDVLALSEPKTKLMVKALNSLAGGAKTLVLIPEKSASYDVIVRATNNIPSAKVLMAGYINIRDLLGYDKIVMPVQAIDVLTAHLG
jgi:large subunit ribosomal protein L4